jgi:hypothetical protein
MLLATAVAYGVNRVVSKITPTGTTTPKAKQVDGLTSLPLKSRIWALDMLNTSSGFAVAGISSVKHDEQLIRTANEGKSWTVVGPLPYSFVAGQLKPLLHFVTPSIGYTQTFRVGTQWVPDNIYVTTNAGKSWSKLKISGEVPSNSGANAYASTSPDFRISNGVVSLVSLDCTASRDSQTYGTCPAELAEYHWGATTPFESHSVPYIGGGSKGIFHSAYLMAAPSAATALVAEDLPSRTSFALTTNGGSTWSLIDNPCKSVHGSAAMTISGVTLTSSRWILNCSQGTGMNHANVLLSETTNDGHSWSTLNYTPAWSAQRGGIAGEIDQVWSSNDGNVLWSYSSVGFIQVSTNGGHTWSPISVNGKVSNLNTGGGPIEFDPVGPTGVYFVSTSGQVLLSHNGVDFTSVRLLQRS